MEDKKKKVPVSVVILTRNEEKNIRDCLESVKWADEIIILDDYSVDGTLEIARSYGARVIQRRWDIEEIHRHYGYSRAENAWVLSLDADERVTPELAQEIIRVIRGKPEYDVYTISRRTYIGPHWVKYGGWYSSGPPRLFRWKESMRLDQGGAYPCLYFDGKMGHLQGDIIHYSFRDCAHYFEKVIRWSRIEAEKWHRGEKKMTLRRALRKGVHRFLQVYVKRRGYRDGFYGFVVAFGSGLYQVVAFCRYHEMKTGDRC